MATKYTSAADGIAMFISIIARVTCFFADERAKALLEWSRLTYSPDEHYWATLHHTYGNPHLNTPGAFAGAYALLSTRALC